VILTKKLSKNFGAFTALDQLDLEVLSKEIVCLLGANGAGKTTTINLLLGFLEPTSGEAFIDGVSVTRSPIDARRKLAYIPEQVALYPSLSGVENLKYFVRLSGLKPSEKALREALSRAGLDESAHGRRVASYSKGMRQKVGVAIALAKNARALLLDEPLSGLDPVASNGLADLLRESRDRGCAILMATHDVFRDRRGGC
jgi:ABC-2 type transport system ATP-binding protein